MINIHFKNAKMRGLWSTVIGALFFLLSHQCLAQEIEQLNIAMTGDGHLETVIISLTGHDKTNPELENYTISVNGSKFPGQYFDPSPNDDSGPSTFPDIKPIMLTSGTAAHQLLVFDYRLGFSVSHILAYDNNRLVTILEVSCAGDGCKAPEPVGKNQILEFTWMGFWWRPDIYTLNSDGLGFTLKPTKSYDVSPITAGFPRSDLKLEPDGCEQSTIPAGVGLKVVEYDANSHRYLLKSSNGACGWIDEFELGESVDGLPLAG